MTSKPDQNFILRKTESYWVVSYESMASPCEILIYCDTISEARELASLAFSQTKRIEIKYSRYRDDNIVYAINNGNGNPVEIDDETFRLLRYAGECYNISEGLFDITSGILRKAWRFDGKDISPDENQIKELLTLIGWDKVKIGDHSITMLPNMQIDLGGVGKEYAVDLVAEMLFEAGGRSLMVNFGGDIRAIAADKETPPWIIGIEDPDHKKSALGEIELANGGVATSGDSQRFCYVNGVRMGHILNPLTGWPVKDAPRSVTVLAQRCIEAGFLATLSMLQGKDSEEFLKIQGVTNHVIR